MSEESKEKRSFDDILWNTFIVIMVIFLGYALLLPRIRHVVDRIQGKKSAVVANAAPAAPEAGPSASLAQRPDATATPPAVGTGDVNPSPASKAPSPSPAPSSGDGTSASTAPHVTVNPPPETTHDAREPATKPKSPRATNPVPASKPPVQAAPYQAHYAVDAGSYTIRSNAERLVSNIPRKHQPHTTITPVKVHGKLFYRVRILVGTKAEADALSTQLLQKEKVHAVILTLR